VSHRYRTFLKSRGEAPVSDIYKVVASTLNVEESVVRAVLSTYSEVALLNIVFQGPLPTVFGEIGVVDNELRITTQNRRLIDAIANGADHERLVESIAAVLGDGR
jgi:hypothetical protein